MPNNEFLKYYGSKFEKKHNLVLISYLISQFNQIIRHSFFFFFVLLQWIQVTVNQILQVIFNSKMLIEKMLSIYTETRMHSSRIRTARYLPYSGGSLSGGLCPGGSLSRSLCLGGLCPGGLCQGDPREQNDRYE